MRIVQIVSVAFMIIALAVVIIMDRKMNENNRSLANVISKYEQEKERADELQSDISAASARVEELEGSVADRDATITSLKEAGKEADATISTLEGNVIAANSRVEELEGTVSAANARVEEMEGTVSAANARVEELEGMVAERDQAIQTVTTQSSAKINELQSSVEKKNQEIESLQSAAADVQKANSEKSQSATDLAALQAQGEEKDQTIKALQSSMEEKNAAIKSLQTAAEQSNATIEALQAEAAKKDQTIESLQNTATQSSTTIEALQAEAAKKDQTIESLQNTATQSNTTIEALQAEAAKKDQTIESLQNTATQNSTTIEALQAEAAKKDQTIESLQNTATQNSTTIEALQAEAAKKDQTIESLQNSAVQNSATIEALQAEAAQKDQTIESLQNNAAQNSATIEALQKSVDENTTKAAEMEAAIAEKDASIMALQSNVAEKDESLSILESSAEQRITELEAAVAQKDERIHELENATPAPTPIPTPEPTPEPSLEPTPEPTFPLHIGSANESVTMLQTKLTELGFKGIEANGILNEGTFDALSRLLSAVGQPRTGVISEALFNGIMALQPTDHQNLIWDGCFASPAEYWTIWGTPQVCEAVNGYLHLIGHTGVLQSVELQAGVPYTLSLIANCSEASQGKAMTCSIRNEASRHDAPAMTLSTQASRFSHTFTVDSTGTYDVMIGNGAEADIEAWYSQVKLESGYVATDWTEHEGTLFLPIQSGSWGDDVKALQTKLIELGYLSGKADGIFGPMTEDALKRLQATMGVEQTGVILHSDELVRILAIESGDGANLLQNGNFTESDVVWALWNKPKYCKIVNLEGRNWLHLVGTGGIRQTAAALKAGQIYTLSFTAYGDEVSIGKPFVCGILSGDVVRWSDEFVLSGSQQQYVYSFVPAQDGDIDILIGTGLDSEVKAWFTDIKLEQGAMATR